MTLETAIIALVALVSVGGFAACVWLLTRHVAAKERGESEG